MVFKTGVAIILIISIWTRPIENAIWTMDKVDELALKILPLGSAKFPDAAEYSRTCDEFRAMAVHPTTSWLFIGGVIKFKEFRDSFFSMFKEKVLNNFCELAKRFETSWNKIAKELNDDYPKLVEVKKKYINAMVASANPRNTIITPPILGCFLKKYADETLALIKTDTSKEVVKQLLFPFNTPISKLKPSPSCSWSKLPEATSQYRSIEILFFEAGKNVLAQGKEAAKKVADEHAKEAAEEAAKKAAKKAAEKAAKKEADRVAAEAGRKAAKIAADEANKKAAEEAAKEAAKQEAEEAVQRAAKEAAKKKADEAAREAAKLVAEEGGFEAPKAVTEEAAKEAETTAAPTEAA